ncbi:MAG: hypothetical protein PHR16_11805 [Methylovulum sp.]|nr:hypothetical protein [Methylovulum sp.]
MTIPTSTNEGDELISYYLHPDGQYREECPMPMPGYALPPMPEGMDDLIN